MTHPNIEWFETLDYTEFYNDIKKVEKTILQDQVNNGTEHFLHFKKIQEWTNIIASLGIITMCLYPNPLTIILLSTWTFAQWTMIGHHVCHGAYESDPVQSLPSSIPSLVKAQIPKAIKRDTFGTKTLYNRITQWNDWFLPEAWLIEHNNRHHYYLNEIDDPDFVQRNTGYIQKQQLPLTLKYLFAIFSMAIWKWYYYAPNTYKEYKIARARTTKTPLPKDFNPHKSTLLICIYRNSNKINELFTKTEYFLTVMAPYLLTHFILLPLPVYLIFGFQRFIYAIINLILAEFATNIHSFIMIVTNHTGDDLYSYNDSVTPKTPQFYLRQIISSANFTTGSDFNDFLHGWLNYQIEHHLFPSISMLSLKQAQPLIKAVCDKHNIPYVQHNVFWRLYKTLQIMTGETKMPVFPSREIAHN